MSQLSGHDATFLYSDTAHSNSNVSLLHIYDQATAPGGKVRFKTILAHIASRLDRSPVFRRRLQRVPLELDYPYWVEDENFDLEYHVRHIALPKPGDWRQFCIQVSRIHARPLDLKRPLWEIYVIEGLDSFFDLPQGSFALLTKTHPAALDIESGSDLALLLHDPTPTPPAPAPPAPWFPAPPPGTAAMLVRSVVHSVSSPLRLAPPLTRVLARLAPTAISFAGDLLRRVDSMPPTRFGSVVSAHRVFDTRRFMLTEFASIRTLVRGATLNDAVLAVCGGALRRYLDAKGELPAASLTAQAPRSIGDGAAASGAPPAPAALHVPLGTHLAEPVARLAFIRQQTVASAAVPSAPWGMARRTPLANCRIVNLPGPRVPQYLCGARMTYLSAILPIADGMGLVLAVTCHDGRVVISPTSCRDLMPDPEVFAQCLRDSFQEYLAAAATNASTSAPRPKGKAPAARKQPAAAARKAEPKKAAPRASSPGRRPPKALRA